MNLARTGLLIAAMTALFLAVGYLIGGQSGLVIALVAALGLNLFAFWNSDKMVLRMHNARPVSPQSAPDLYALVQRLAQNAGLPMPAVYLIETDQPNAFATGRSPERSAVAVTRGLLAALSRDELAGVVAHELAHIKNRDTLTMTIAATIAGAIGFLANFAFFFGGSSENRNNPLGIIGTILVMLLAPLAAMLVQMAISRTREYSADRLGAQICGHPLWLANALQRIEALATGRVMPSAEHNPASAHLFIINPLRMGGVDGLFRTHPATEDRVRRLVEMGRPNRATNTAPASFTQPASGPWGHAAARPWGGSSPSPTRAPSRGSVPSAGRR